MSGWIKDGTWPIDPKTKRAMAPPGSPFLSAQTEPEEVPVPRDDTPTAPTEEESVDDGLIGDNDLHVGGDVWRGAEEGLVKADHG